MRIAPPGLSPDATAEPDDLIREARRRQRRRWLAAGVASAIVVAGLAGVVAGLTGHRHGRANSHRHLGQTFVAPRAVAIPPPIPRSIGTRVLWWPAGFGQCCGAVAVDNLSTGRITQRQEPDISMGDFQPLLTQVGRWFVYVGNGVTVIRDDLSGHPRVLGADVVLRSGRDPRPCLAIPDPRRYEGPDPGSARSCRRRPAGPADPVARRIAPAGRQGHGRGAAPAGMAGPFWPGAMESRRCLSDVAVFAFQRFWI
jgi:hypothetical protein